MKGGILLQWLYHCMFVFLIIVAFFGCNTTKKDFKNVDKAIYRHPEQTLVQFNKRWPIVPLAVKKDSTELKKYLKELQDLKDSYNDQHPERVQLEADTIIKKWEDSAKVIYYMKLLASRDDNIKYLKSYIDTLTRLCATIPPEIDSVLYDGPKLFIAINERDKAIADRDVLQKRLDIKEKWLWILAIIAVVLTAYNIIRVYLKYKIPIKL